MFWLPQPLIVLQFIPYQTLYISNRLLIDIFLLWERWRLVQILYFSKTFSEIYCISICRDHMVVGFTTTYAISAYHY